jgi:hypothetical protein
MPDPIVLADLACQHAASDVYDLWVQGRGRSVLFGWQSAAAGRYSFCLDGAGNLHPVAVPWTPAEADLRRATASCEDVTLRAAHALGIGGDDANSGVRVHLDDEATEFSVPGASLLFPCVRFDDEGMPHVLMVRTEDVGNADGVIDQHNFIMAARHDGEHWVIEEIADLKYGLMPKAGVWGYPGKRRHPYLVPDDRGGVWALWERKEPHDGNTRTCHGVLLGRRFAEGGWGETLRIIEQPHYDFAPDERGVIGGEMIVAAQRGVPISERGRGEVLLLKVGVDAAVTQPEDEGWDGWSVVDLARREFFAPQEREVELAGDDYRLLFGDPHTHTGLSEDAEGDLLEMLSYARDKAQIDFVAFTDNDYIYGGRLSDEGWRETMRRAQEWSRDGSFIVVPAYEWTQAKWGAVTPQHRSVLFERYDEPMLRWADAGIGQANDAFDALLAWVETTSGILNTQHRQFAVSKSPREANMEVVCGWGDYINQSDCFHEHLNAGYRAGFIGTSDGHRRTPGLGGGLTGLWVREFTLGGIIDALRSRRCYATAGARIGLRFWLNDAFMGEETPEAEGYRARVAVDAPREVEALEIIGDGEVIATLRDLSASFDETIEGLPACGWYYAKVTMPGGFVEYPSNIAPAEGPWAWSSPVFVGE